MTRPAARRPPPPIPLTLLTGFLGAGKTTLLNQLVRSPEFDRSVVIINEFGDVAVDHQLVEKTDGDLLTLASGCICCAVRGDLVAMLEDLLRRRDNNRMPPFDRVLIETTGLAAPGPILNAIPMHPYLALRFRVEAVVTVVDALHGAATLDRHPEAIEQVAMADALVLTKTDLALEDAVALRERLADLNARAPIFDAAAGEASAAAVLGAGIGRSALWADAPAPEAHLAHGEDGIASVVLTAATPIPESGLAILLDLLLATQGAALLRIKGLVATREDPDHPLVVQGVQRLLHPSRKLAAWPDADRRSRLVLIGRGLDTGAAAALWDAVCGSPAVDRPDAAGLAHALGDRGPGLF